METANANPTAPHPCTGRTVLITGASSGLGLALARAFARTGANVALVARSEDNLKAAAALLEAPPDRVLAVSADLTQRDQVNAAVARAVGRFGGLHAAVSCAGQGLLGPLADTPWDEIKHGLDINLFGALHLAQAVLPHLRQQADSQLVFISSILGLRGFPRSAIYSAAKFGVAGLAESLRLELKKDRVHVLIVCPGRLATPFLDRARTLDGKKGLKVERALDPDVVAARIVAAMSAHKRMLILPFSARLLHWVNLWCPSLVDRVLLRKFDREGLL